MNKKSFFWGVATGTAIGVATSAILTFVVIFVIGSAKLNSEKNSIQFLEKPVSYENKTETSFKVFQVLDSAALATEASDDIDDEMMYFGKTVLVLGNDFYTDQIITVKNPLRIGTYSRYGNTVPVIEGEKE